MRHRLFPLLWVVSLLAAALYPLGALAQSAGPDAHWRADSSQTEAWLSALKESPSSTPAVSIKIAVPSDAAVDGADLSGAVWTDVPWDGPVPEPSAVERLGVRSVWHGIPFQEVLLAPLQPSPLAAHVRILQACGITLRFNSPERLERASVMEPGNADAALFANPDVAASLQASRAQALPESAPGPESTFPGPRVRLSVSRDGIYRVDSAYLTARSIDFSTWTVANIHLTCRGVEVPIWIEGSAAGTFSSASAIIFYGQRLKLPARIMWNGGDFSDTNVYWLYADSTPGLRMPQAAADPSSGYPVATTFTGTAHLEKNTYNDATDHLRPNGDLWYWSPSIATALGGGSWSQALSLPHATGTGVTVTGVLAGLTTATHTLTALFNGAAPSSGGPLVWTGKTLASPSWTFPASPLPSGNTLTLTLTAPPASSDAVFPDYFDVAYPRTFDADGGSLRFTGPSVDATYSCPGFASAPIVLDISQQNAAELAVPRFLVYGAANFSAGTVTFQLPADSGVTTRAVALADTPLAPDGAQMSSAQDLTSPSLGCDLLIITHPDFHPAGADAVWQTYLARRLNAPMAVTTVDVQDIFDQFSQGIFDPTAIKAFLTAAYYDWSPRPKYVLLIGDGTYDYKNYLQHTGAQSRVPTMMFEDVTDSTYMGRYPSDAWFADVNGDGFPDMAVGRIPAHSYAELAGVLSKIMAYEDQSLSGTWYKTGLYLADTYIDGTWEQVFETYNTALAATYGAAPWAAQTLFYRSSPDATAFATAIKAAWPQSALVHYAGHSGVFYWGFKYFFGTTEAANLPAIDLTSPFAPLPFVINSSCYNSAFDEATTSALMQSLVLRPDGGSIGSCGFTTIAYVPDEETFNNAIFGDIFGRLKVRTLGDLVEAGRFTLPSSNVQSVMGNALLGDPSMKLRLPAPPPPSSLSATDGNASVSLSWSPASPTPAGYNLYRSTDGGATWTQANAALITATAYVDTGLVNTQSYAYYITSVDSQTFEGAPSAAATATPLNPNPPLAPTGLHAADTGTGTAATVSWNANSEPDLSGYVLVWGTSSGVYTGTLALPAGSTTALVGGLTNGVTYYFAVAARNTSGLQSPNSAEAVCAMTGLRLAIRPPALINDLKVTKSGQDLVLTWTKPSTDVGGAPTTVNSFLIYRVVGAYDWNLDRVSTAPPNAKISLDASSNQSVYTYTDREAMTLPNPLTYLVVALDAQGLRSPASHAPPSPVMDLKVTRGVTGNTLLSFTPVTTDVTGQALPSPPEYRVYGFYPMTASSDHVNPPSPVTIPPCQDTAAFCDASSSPPLFYTVVAVDNRGNTSLY